MTSTTPASERTLILARHAKAEHVQEKPDHDRELTPRGWRDARAIGKWLSDPLHAEVARPQPGTAQVGVLDLALCSTSQRTRQTLEGVRAGGAAVKDVRFDARLYGAHAAQLLDVLREVPDSVTALLMIGHAPGVPVLAMALAQDNDGSTDAGDRISRAFPTSALAVLAFGGRWAELAPEKAYLRDFVVPRG
jgi:phosphohistidine phosphatase